MMRKPHIRHGRFFNGAGDTLRARIKEITRTMALIARHNVRKQPAHDKQQAHELWRDKPVIIQRSDELRITWLGHATFLIQVAGFNILTDPVFYEIARVTPRYVDAPITPEELPPIDVILISHNHRDHTDTKSLQALLSHQPQVFVPQGDRGWFLECGFRTVTQAAWWELFTVGDVALTFLPANHWSGRHLFDINLSLWGSWMINVNGKKIYFAGDTAYDEHFKAIHKAFGNIEVVLMPIGPNQPYTMRETHVSAHEAVKAFIDLGGRHLVPMHWGTFKFGTDAFMDPYDLLLIAWAAHADKLEDRVLHTLKHGHHVGPHSVTDTTASNHRKGT